MLCAPEKVVSPFFALSSSGQGEMRVTPSTWYGALCMQSACSVCFIISEDANKYLETPGCQGLVVKTAVEMAGEWQGGWKRLPRGVLPGFCLDKQEELSLLRGLKGGEC